MQRRLFALSENLGQTYTSSTKNEILIIAMECHHREMPMPFGYLCARIVLDKQ